MIDPSSLRKRPVAIDRSSDRLVALSAIVVALGFLIAAVIVVALPATRVEAPWLPLHLALAGGATTAIAGVMPFFAAAFAAAPPSDARLRSGAVGLVAGGALAVSIGVAGDATWLGALGGIVFVAGTILVAVVTVRPLRKAFGPSRGIVVRGYVAAVAAVAVGATIATLFVSGIWPGVIDWPRWRAAHAWLNVVGFVSLVIATTLLHFFPTVIGARIANHPTARATVLGIAGGAAVTATGIGTGLDIVARIGAVGVGAGVVALVAYAIRVWRTRAGWTSDHAWHRFAMGGLVSAICWFVVGAGIAVGRVLVLGADPASWSLVAVAGPLVAGWAGLALLASATHLIPAVGPGGPIDHAAQRVLLGRWATARLILLEGGVAGLAIGLPFDLPVVAGVGVALIAIGLAATVALLARAIGRGLRRRPVSPAG